VFALLAQFAFDSASSWVRNCYGLRVPVPQLASALGFTFVCDLFLAPIGFAAARAVPHSPGALLFLLPPTALLAMLQLDRRKHIDHTIALGAAFTDTSDLARRDALTGVANRLSWEEITARLQRLDDPIGVILADVDGLKAANDTHGHATGDRLLLAVTDMLQQAVPYESGGVLFRVGGDEFAILLPAATEAETNAVGSALRAAFANAPSLDGVVPVSASVGAGFATDGTEFGPAVATADRGVHLEKDRRGVRRR
jgi:diguanylate cyclase (GGDEF)-like protein